MPGTPRRRRSAAVLLLTGAVAAGFACSSEPERSVAAYCAQAGALMALDADLASGDPARIQIRLEELRALQQVAPSEVEPSLALLTGITDDFARTAGTVADREQVADEVFRGRSEEIESIEAAGRTVADYTLANCRLDVDGPGSTVGPSSGPDGAGSAPTSGDDGSGSPASSAPATTTTSRPSLLVD